MKRALSAVILSCTLLLVTAPIAEATWSIVGVDPETGEVGVAIASCVPGSALGDLSAPLSPVVLVPGLGAGVSQAELNDAAPAELAASLLTGLDAEATIAAVTDPSFDERASVRQHAIVSLAGDVAAFTGAETLDVTLDRQASNVSAQGNILVSNAVIDDALASFESTPGDLATRLVAALQAGSDAGGDSRCGDQTALFAHVAVATPDDFAESPSVLLTVAVAERTDANPVDQLSEAFANGQRQGVIDSSPSASARLLVLVGTIAITAVVVTIGVRFARRRLGKNFGV